MDNKNIELLPNCGLKCDNPKCDWRDDTITYEVLEQHINARCPKCGQNVLTEKDYENAMIVKLTADFINSLSPEELQEMTKDVKVGEMKDHPMFSDAKGLEHLEKEQKVLVSMNTHNDITFYEIKPISEQNDEECDATEADSSNEAGNKNTHPL